VLDRIETISTPACLTNNLNNMPQAITIFWHRRDLRIEDNAGLYKSLKSNCPVMPIFIFDKNILSKLPSNDQRVRFIHEEITRLKAEYQELGSELNVYYGEPLAIFNEISTKFDVKIVFLNRDYEPYAVKRDQQIYDFLNSKGIEMIGAKDHVIFEKNEIVKDDQKPYTIFTPYSKKWKAKLESFHLKAYPTLKYSKNLLAFEAITIPALFQMGFENAVVHKIPGRDLKALQIDNYDALRNIPSKLGTSRMSVHLRFGTISIRELANIAKSKNEQFLNELIWRDFYQMIIHYFPHSINNSFKAQYDKIVWENDETQFEAWCEGKTGYPIVDAGMRELNATGFMHNRVRMITASFLTKHLLIDWRWGEAYFAEKLLDFDLASNVGGWQWAASSGCDAAPYFRVFNPELQTLKFDKDLKYVKEWIPEYGTTSYLPPIVDHKFARERVLARFKEALNG